MQHDKPVQNLMLRVISGGCSGPARLSPSNKEHYVKQFGPPDLVEQHSGDLARRFDWGSKPENSWQLDSEYYIYEARQVVAKFKNDKLVKELSLSNWQETN